MCLYWFQAKDHMLEVDEFSWQLHNNKQCNYYWIFSSYVIHTLIALSLNTLLGWTDQSLDQYPFQLQTLNSQKLFRKPLYRTHIPWSAVLVNFGNGISVPEKIESTSINILWKFFIHIYFILMGHNAHLNTSLFTVLKDYTRVNTFIKIRWIILQPQPLIFTLSNSLICYSFKTVWSDIFLLDFHDSAHIYWEKIHLTSVICQFCGYQIALNQFLSSRNTYIWQFLRNIPTYCRVYTWSVKWQDN